MKREIKFRGKRVDNDKWVYGDLIHLGWNEYIYPQNMHNLPSMGEMYRHHVISDTIGQYTGLHDCEGREIYEGDIIAESGDIVGSIVLTSRYGVSVQRKSIRLSLKNFCLDRDFDYGTISNIKVVGNIHDNPELLKGGK